MSDKPDSQIKAAFIQGLDDNTLVCKLLSKPSFTFDDCYKYALETVLTHLQLRNPIVNQGPLVMTHLLVTANRDMSQLIGTLTDVILKHLFKVVQKHQHLVTVSLIKVVHHLHH